MTEALPADEPQGPNLRTVTHVIYGLFALGLISAGVLGLATVAAIVLAYLKRGDAAGTVYAPHFGWVLKTFWWGLLWLVLSALATPILVGWLTGAVALVWVLYRLIKGWLALFSGQSPDGEA
ncbi:hypothetical protein KVP10_17740 [Candidimonas humi]|jgi:uncharacterized membrane protein|uniref:DUF4870 family protein n=1 Tax=Candidimonas humi TaxID=683355 RepID=A0ABV8P030_9BURK|nr:hypothetical protein [Candidimonas humi]MBV6306735.1 hypothetical protein [Candidimonas humi]